LNNRIPSKQKGKDGECENEEGLKSYNEFEQAKEKEREREEEKFFAVSLLDKNSR
jgi:hypothetical protein